MATESNQPTTMLRESSATYGVAPSSDVDASLIAASLAMSPWERMQANDDALNFADSLRAAMMKRHAKPL
jgi:hypothetical protein